MTMLYDLPYLNAAVNFTSAHGNQCVQRSAALMFDIRNATFVFAAMRAATEEEQKIIKDASPVPFIHAWVEVGDQVLAPTLLERFNFDLQPVPKDIYYQANGVGRTWRLSQDEFMKVAKKIGLASALKHGKDRAGSRVTVDALLKAAKVRWFPSERNTLLAYPEDAGK